MKKNKSVEIDDRYSPGIKGVIKAMGAKNAAKTAYCIAYALFTVPLLCVSSIVLGKEAYEAVASVMQCATLMFVYFIYQAVKYHSYRKDDD